MNKLNMLLEEIKSSMTERYVSDDHIQKMFNPVDYEFKWTSDWYDWDSKKGHQLAMQARNQEAAKLKKQGWKVKKFTLRNQRVKRGGIGSGHPEVDNIVTVYGFNADK